MAAALPLATQAPSAENVFSSSSRTCASCLLVSMRAGTCPGYPSPVSPANLRTACTSAPLGPFPHPVPRRSDFDLCATVLGASLLPACVSLLQLSQEKTTHQGLRAQFWRRQVQDPGASRTGFW
ncbi:hypothetical protein HJG60_008865 [Phyllostomus discolor]|uniref:Uncharacterized protein n=1 Tax=Phyllostomus discolor TaxID=89673 RepID=A0A833YZ70_9CHIR|nr:hypothetical protein HJG60_008865 [Phyllostomus discolor]